MRDNHPPAMESTVATTYSPEYLAESRTSVLTAFYAIPIALEILSTAFRLWVKARPSSKSPLTFDDYLIVWATVRLAPGLSPRFRMMLL